MATGVARTIIPRAAGRVRRALGAAPAAQAGTASTTALLASLLELARSGPAPLVPGSPSGAAMHVAAVIPSFRRGSGGHATIVHMLEGLRARGHEVSVWLEDCDGRHAAESASTTTRAFAEFFGARQIELRKGFSDWRGADVLVATGWQTVARVLLLDGASARAYLVQDHEPDFYGASAEAEWARASYRQGLHCIAASEWLAALLRERYGASATHFDLAVDHSLYRPDAAGDPNSVAGERVAFYARALTPRRAVPLGLAALAELHRRRPRVEIVLYGEDRPLAAPFPHRNCGLLDGAGLARLYHEATVGMVLSLTNPSLVTLEMMACGLPCVEVAVESTLACFGVDGPPALAAPQPLALCDTIEQLLEDPALRQRTALAGMKLMAARTWEVAAAQFEHGLRMALETDVRTAR